MTRTPIPPPVTPENRDELKAFMMGPLNPGETIEEAAKRIEKKTERI